MSSGLNEKIEEELDRLKELSMEVIPVKAQESVVQSARRSQKTNEFRIHKGKSHFSKRLSLLKQAYHPQDSALLMLYEKKPQKLMVEKHRPRSAYQKVANVEIKPFDVLRQSDGEGLSDLRTALDRGGQSQTMARL